MGKGVGNLWGCSHSMGMKPMAMPSHPIRGAMKTRKVWDRPTLSLQGSRSEARR